MDEVLTDSDLHAAQSLQSAYQLRYRRPHRRPRLRGWPQQPYRILFLTCRPPLGGPVELISVWYKPMSRTNLINVHGPRCRDLHPVTKIYKILVRPFLLLSD